MDIKTLKDSPYAFIPKKELLISSLNGVFETDVKKMFRDKVYGQAEHDIIEGLYRFPVMNRKTLTRYLELSNNNNSPNWYYKILKRLVKDNIINCYSYDETRFYALMPYVRNLWRQKRSFDVTPVSEDISSILECAALSQFAVSVMEEVNLKHIRFYQSMTMAKNNIWFPFYAEFKMGAINYRMVAISAPRGRNDLTHYFYELNTITDALDRSVRKGIATLFVLCVSSIREMEKLNELFKVFFKDCEQHFYYSLDLNSAELFGLDCLYYFDDDYDEGQLLKTISIIA